MTSSRMAYGRRSPTTSLIITPVVPCNSSRNSTTSNKGDLSIVAYYSQLLRTLGVALIEYEKPIKDRALVHHLIHDLNAKYHVLRLMLLAMLVFSVFIEAQDQLIVTENTFTSDLPKNLG
ncbi:hypothetical protein Zm00014a_039717 [Zea mays]|uniref:Uncharacterized protein n=1 Tax=Zea mays TaxID=4577 RepID=A0A3L6F549_MAIZE|nr:hypothetical protein Zm00014a_039717 [Zea mays]